MSSKDQTLADMPSKLGETEAVLATIPEDRMLEPGVVEEWSVRDLLAHIAGYERYVSALIFGDLEGRTPTNQQFYGRDDAPTPEDDANDDTSNAWVVEYARKRELQDTLTEYRWAHQQMIEAVETCTDADLEDPNRFPSLKGKTLLAILPGQCMGHHREHLPQIEAFAQPLRGTERTITIHLATATAQFPARFQLILATNPCPCGDYGIRGGTCTCVPAAIRRYLGRLSGPLLDRMDIELTMARVSVAQAGVRREGAVTTAAARARVDAGAAKAGGDPVAPQRAAARHVAARGAVGAAGPDPPPPGRRAPSRCAHPPRLRPRAAGGMDPRRSRRSTAARRSAHRPRPVSEEGPRTMTDFDLNPAAARRALARVEAPGGRDDAGMLDRFALVVWSHLTEPGDGAAGRLVRELGAADALRAAMAGTPAAALSALTRSSTESAGCLGSTRMPSSPPCGWPR